MTDDVSSITIVQEEWERALGQLESAKAHLDSLAKAAEVRAQAGEAFRSASTALDQMTSSLTQAVHGLTQAFGTTETALAQMLASAQDTNLGHLSAQVTELSTQVTAMSGLIHAQTAEAHTNKAELEAAHAALAAERDTSGKVKERLAAMTSEKQNEAKLARETKQQLTQATEQAAAAKSRVALLETQLASERESGAERQSSTATGYKEVIRTLISDIDQLAGLAGARKREEARTIARQARQRAGL